jgi:hypothetical protein
LIRIERFGCVATEKGKFHFEFFNEHDWLQRASFPGLRQNTSNFSLNYDLADRVELGINAPMIKIFNSPEFVAGKSDRNRRYDVLQKSLTKRTMGRLNGGILFADNTSTGLIGIQTSRGQVFTANGSLVRDFTPKLKLAAELFGGVTNNFNLTRGQLESQIGGSYALRDNFSFTFGVLAGRFPASPRIGFHLGLAYDFK